MILYIKHIYGITLSPDGRHVAMLNINGNSAGTVI
jgi:hypothetical protein